MIMITAATDTIYAALSFALLLAAKYPLIQQELNEELVNAFGHNIDNIELKNGGILRIPKLRAFIHETLRIFPPVAAAGFRQLTGDGIKLDTTNYGENKDYMVPNNTMTMINICGIG